MDESLAPQPSADALASLESALESGLEEIQSLLEQIERDHARSEELKASTARIQAETNVVAARVDARLKEMATGL